MPLRHPRYRGRHAAPKRHVVAPFLIAGSMVFTVASVGLPETATASGESDRLRPSAGSAVTSAANRIPLGTDRSQAISRSGTTDRALASFHIVHGKHLTPKPPPWVLPVVGYHLTARFGQVSGLWSHVHTGLDFAAPQGTEIRSIAPGTVLSTEYDGAYGNKTEVRLDDGTVLWYCHQNDFAVNPGQRLAAGELLGYVGSTGNVTGPHLHLEVHPHGGGPIDPEAWLPEHHLHP